MSVFLIVFFSVALDRLFGEPSRFHPLVGFGNIANKVERWLNTSRSNKFVARALGVLGIFLLICPFVLLAKYLSGFGLASTVFEIFILYIAIGARSLQEHAMNIYSALSVNNIELARKNIGMIVSRDTSNLNSKDISSASVESVLENGCDAIFAALFWFLIAGAPGVVLYRLSNTLDAMWGYKTVRYLHFGWAAARLDDALNYIPARLTALTYALLGQYSNAVNCWREQGHLWKSPNAGPVMAAGAGALSLQLGGEAIYHGERQIRPVLGKGNAASAIDIKRAVQLINRSLILWILICFLIWGGLQIA